MDLIKAYTKGLPPENEAKQFGALVAAGGQWVIIPHVNPDGDAIGACLGLSHILSAAGIESRVVLPDTCPDYLRFIAGSDQMIDYKVQPQIAEDAIKSADVIVWCDFNAANRCGDLEKPASLPGKQRIMIDHHLNPPAFDGLMISHKAVSSTCELIVRLVAEANLIHLMSLEAASALFVGILTDTGGFAYSCSEPAFFGLVSALMTFGVDKDAIWHEINNRQSEGRVRLTGFALAEKMEIIPEFKTSVIALNSAEMQRFDYKPGDTEGIVNLPLAIEGVEYSFLITERDNRTRISMRSIGNNPVNTFASTYFDGGGHKNASGANSGLNVADTAKRLKQLLPELLKLRK